MSVYFVNYSQIVYTFSVIEELFRLGSIEILVCIIVFYSVVVVRSDVTIYDVFIVVML